MREKHIRKVTLKTGVFYDVRFCVNYKDVKEGRFDTLETAIKHRNSVYPKYGIVPKVDKNLTQEELQRFVHYDSKTGIFTRKNRSGNGKVGDIFNTINGRGYIEMSFNNHFYKAHRLAFLYMNGSVPKSIDHINGIKTDNGWGNLREVTASQNSRNAKLREDNKYGIVGVSKDTNGSWRARISTLTEDGKLLYQGPDFFEACCARKSAERYYNYHENHGRLAAG